MKSMKPNDETLHVKHAVAFSCALIWAAGCGASSDSESNVSAVQASACTPGYVAIGATGSCRDVQGTDGFWDGAPLFPDAPAATEGQYCGYRWNAASHGAAPENELMKGLTARVVSPACLTTTVPLVEGKEEEKKYPSPLGIHGVQGCDVCVNFTEGRLFLVFPPEMKLEGIVVFPLDDGSTRAFHFERPREDTISVEGLLPADLDEASIAPGTTLL